MMLTEFKYRENYLFIYLDEIKGKVIKDFYKVEKFKELGIFIDNYNLSSSINLLLNFVFIKKKIIKERIIMSKFLLNGVRAIAICSVFGVVIGRNWQFYFSKSTGWKNLEDNFHTAVSSDKIEEKTQKIFGRESK